jgi:serine/threonine protein kinase
LYSLGVVAYELITGRSLFDEHVNPELRLYLASCVSPPSTYNKSCPREMDELLLGALASDPEERWQTAYGLCSAIALIGEPAPERVREWLDRTDPHRHALAPDSVPPLPSGALPAPPSRTARGTGPQPPPAEAAQPTDSDESIEDDETVIEPCAWLGESHDAWPGSGESIHEAETMIRHGAPRAPRDLQLPLEPPSDPYLGFEVVEESGAPNQQGAESGTPSAASSSTGSQAPSWPLFAPLPEETQPSTLLPTREGSSLRRYVELGIAFVAGAITMYLTL